MRRWLLIFALISTAHVARADDESGLEFFERRIRPVLVKHCYACHSRQAKKLRAGLYLDSKRGWQRGGESGPAIVPGKPAESLLLAGIKYDGFMMPPRQRLSASVVADFEKWIRMGAPDPRGGGDGTPPKRGIDLAAAREYWAFRPPLETPLPQVRDARWPRGTIDRHILSRLEREGLSPARKSDRRNLVRRIYFDLIGLPPTPAEQAEFINDESPNAYERLVDKLLGSPQFGEKWGRHWLDVARYADSNGGDINLTFFNAWRYRDYVISAFNRDKPFDEFVREQIGGDLMQSQDAEQRKEQLIATGFLIVGPKMLSERDKERLYLDVADEQIDSIGRAFLGLTLGCARCHDHKFDPISTKDYYALTGIFRSTETVHGIRMGNVNVSGWLERKLPIAPEHVAALDKHEKAMEQLASDLKKAKSRLAAAQRAANSGAARSLGIVVDDLQAQLVGQWKKSTATPRYVGEGYIHDDLTGKGKKSVTYIPDLPVAGSYEVRMAFASGGGRSSRVPVTIRHADGVARLMVNEQPTPPIDRLWKPLGRFRFAKGTSGSVVISTEGTKRHVIADAVQFIPVAELVAQTRKSPEAARRQAEVTRASDAVSSIERRIAELKKNAPPPAPTAMAVRDRAEVNDAHVHIRGETRQLGEKVGRGFPAVLHFPGQPEVNAGQSGRVELARWIADERNPLTARVLVNRIWHHLLGQGIVPTVDNFGVRGSQPSHPELLDYLARRFVERDWSVKRLVREIVLSATYQMSCDAEPRALRVDPSNRWLSHQNRRRLPVESFRDAILAVSRHLDTSSGGSSVEALSESAISNTKSQSGGLAYENWARRSVYLPIVRNDLPHVLVAFDFANPDVVSGARSVTTVPGQALWLMNSPFVRNAAERIARELIEIDDAGERIDRMFQQILSRRPSSADVRDVKSYVSGALAELVEKEKMKPHDAERAAWTGICQILLSSTRLRFLE